MTTTMIEPKHPSDYQEFLASKRPVVKPAGFDVDPDDLNPHLFAFQRACVAWALGVGRAALFEDCGLGKAIQALAWAEKVAHHTGRPVLILAPLAVAQQFRREGEKFGVPVTVCKRGEDVRAGVNAANYERLHLFDPSVFGGIVLDESSCLKSYMGKTKQALIEAFRDTPFKLACTATPAPNDHLELGNHAEFLGVMPSNEMIMRWFINDTMSAGKYRLKGHAERDFWRWVSSWAVSIGKPSDLGYPDDGFILPPLEWVNHVVEVDLTEGADGALFRAPTLSAMELAREKRRTLADRVEKVAAVVGEPSEPWLVWTNLNDEQDALAELFGNRCFSVYGSLPLEEKERRIVAWLNGERPVMVSKASIIGFGINAQVCPNQIFTGLDYSFESLYQAVRRSWRFGQEKPVRVHIVMAETEGRVLSTVREKAAAHERMKAAMVEAMRETQLAGQARRSLVGYDPQVEMSLPAWLTRGVAA